jgi:mannose-6-phosphate isomerase-like protein (cupin superfamily)
MVTGKKWGWSQCIFKNDNFEVHLIKIKKGYYCSTHLHKFKHNLFFVLKGILNIKVWKNDYELIDVTTIKKFEATSVSPLEKHRFESVSTVYALEIYYPEPISGDIVRFNCGGKFDE